MNPKDLDEDDRSIEELREQMTWDEEGIATLLDEDDSEYIARKDGPEY